MVAGAELNREAIEERLERGYLDATTLMEYLIGKGVPQRTAHHLVGTLVAAAMQRRVPLADLPIEEYQRLHPDLDEDIYGILGVENAVRAFVSYGSTAPAQVQQQVERWREKLEMGT
jgi:argininosuccinate lyase